MIRRNYVGREGRRPLNSSVNLVPGISNEDLKLLASYADRAFEDIDWLYDSDEETLAEHDYDQNKLYRAQQVASLLYNMID